MSSVPTQGFNVTVAVPFQTVNAAGNSGVIGNNEGLSISSVIDCTAITGTLSVALQVSQDGGATWEDLWHFEPITSVASAIMPALPVFGTHRYSWTLSAGGSATFNVTETGSAQACALVRRFFDYTAALLAGTLNAASAVFDVAGASAVTATVTLGAVTTTAGTYVIDVSPDGVNWIIGASATLGVASSTVALSVAANLAFRFARVRCSVAASGQTGVAVSLTAR